jgi:uncharacterized RDD family membrane protein YckC
MFVMRNEPQPLRRHETIAPQLRQVVLAPEQVELHMPVAGPTSRMMAYAIDAVVITVIQLGLLALVFVSTDLAGTLLELLQSEMAQSFTPDDLERLLTSSYVLYFLAAMVLVQYVVELSYFTLWETVWSGRSLGKALLRLRVVGDGGRALTTAESLTRNLLRIVDLLPSSYLVGLMSILLSPEGKRLGDVAAGTVVIRLDRPLPPHALPQAEASTFRFDRAQVARIGALDRQLILQTLRRIDALPPEHASALLARSAEVIRQRIGYPEVSPEERRAFLRAVLEATGGV